MRLIVPLTGWQQHFSGNLWMVKIGAALGTGLTKDSTADTFQLRGVDLMRFAATGPVGRVPDADLKQITAAIAVTVGHGA